ncbi:MULTISPECIES: MFS transporter [unclassified Janthinobacterium]|uniref:MFS transporter n=1 Tax=unclassified Janthinobacterium TaxID=2610881 RepID=UPI00160CB6B9|nr:MULTISPECIES: MFS transporter [unclassified Janthinobacterium]MBB5371428.1 EmrB/QacA subfamily drug resistance transporter [Janthinobacterium sp. K2C7]MBB5384234.1 EmrB/QacA subfamily drug resistance transporter [Janthinobacterium sp. K2Li3]MBB5389509.1 EmrB/QacA subfamily drug resistance transporter [Janthinobacterium sp. K2E3]
MEYRKKVAAIYLLGFFVDLVNMFITNVAYPGIGHAFGASVPQLAWISTAYILGLTIVIPASAWLAAYYGSKTVFITSLLIFLCASAGAGLAQSIAALIAWRLLQGLGGGLLIPLGQSMTYQLYAPAERPGLSSIIMLVGLLAPALSPALGGLIVDSLSWRAIFYLNLPLAALALLLAARWLRAEPARIAPPPLDMRGLLAGSTAISLLLLGLTMLGSPGDWPAGAAVLALGAVCAVVYVRGALKKSAPLLNLRLVAEPLLRISMLMYLLVPGVFMGVSLLAMLYLQGVLGMTASMAGSLMLPWAIASFAAISLTGKSYRRVGPQPLFIAGALLQAAGMLMLLRVDAASQIAWLSGAYAVMGFGGALCSSTAQSTAFLRIPDGQLSQASAVWNINRQIGFCLGVAVLGVLLNFLLALHGIGSLEDPRASTVFHWCFALAAASCLLPLVLCLRIDNRAVLKLVFHPQESKK